MAVVLEETEAGDSYQRQAIKLIRSARRAGRQVVITARPDFRSICNTGADTVPSVVSVAELFFRPPFLSR